MLHKNKKKQETKVDSYMPCVSNGPHPQVAMASVLQAAVKA